MATEKDTTPGGALPYPASSSNPRGEPGVHPEVSTDPADSSKTAGGLLEWLLRRGALRGARESLPARASRFHQTRERARVACELADRLVDPVDPLRSGNGMPLAIDLYRQAIYWSLCALFGASPEAQQPSTLCSAALSAHGAWLAPDLRTREALTALLSDDFSFIAIAALGDKALAELARDARAVAKSSLEALEGPERRVQQLAFQRALRLSVCFVCVSLLAFGTLRVRAWNQLRPNLATGKAWRTSSTRYVCEPAIGLCGGKSTAIFFHTNEEPNPWIEYDLGTVMRFSRVYVRNRNDAAPDRAIPLVVEVSSDRDHWKTRARQRETFTTWTAKFAPVWARYVRLRVARRSLLHLEEVRVLP